MGSRNSELATLFGESRPSAGPANQPLAFTFQQGDARYERLKPLGHGGMGEVLLCRDATIGREVALKIARGTIGSRSDVRARFLVEARVQGQLEHPAIVPVYDLAVDAEGALYFTMKRVRGRTLEDVLRGVRDGDAEHRERFGVRRLLAEISKLCLALDFVHQHAVVHRDIKPANIMLGDFGEVYLLDWGLAKITGEVEPPPEEVASHEHTRTEGQSGSGSSLAGAVRRISVAGASADGHTEVGALLGTPGYMPPEQAALPSAVDDRADVYALGAVLFEFLAGEPLHRGRGSVELIQSTVDGVEARPSVRAPSREIAPELDALVLDATQLEPGKRPSAREVHERIERYLDGHRDVERRRALAETLVREAERAREGTDEAARKEALRKLGRALALDPENAHALRAMVSLLTTPPRELPAAVRQELFDQESRQTKQGGRVGAVAFLSLNVWLLVALSMGPTSYVPIALFAVLTTTTALASFWVSRSERPSSAHAMGVLVLGLLTGAMASAFFGPFMLAPSIIAVITLVFSLNHPAEWRGTIVGLGIGAAFLPAVLEWTGLLPPSMQIAADGVLILPRYTAFPFWQTMALMIVGNVAVIATAGAAMAPIRSELDDAQRRIRLSAWQLRQLVPDELDDHARTGSGEQR